MSKTITAYKGFNLDFTCRDFQFEVGKTYTHEGTVEACGSGFHACAYPLDVLSYYPASTSKFAIVSLTGDTDTEEGGDTKIAAATITITTEIQLDQLISDAVKYVFDAAKWVKGKAATGDRGAASATGNRGAASATGDRGAASATGDSGAASATGYKGRVMASEGSAIFLAERDIDNNILHVFAGIAGQDGIKPLTFYTLTDGKPVEVTA